MTGASRPTATPRGRRTTSASTPPPPPPNSASPSATPAWRALGSAWAPPPIDGDVQNRSLIIHDLTNSTVDDIDQSRVAGIYNQTGNVKVSNTIVYDITDLSTHPSSRAYGMHFDEAGATAYVFNNTI